MAPILNAGRIPSITNGFAHFLTAPGIAEGVKKGLDEEINEAKTDPYDSHPPLRDRISAANQLSVSSPTQNADPAWSLVENINLAELSFLEAANPEMPKNSLRHVSWEESGDLVLIPSWEKSVAENAGQLQGITIGNLPTSLGKVPDIAAQMRDPEGMLLTPEQRIPRARRLLASAFALALVKKGWKLHSLPGEFYLEKNGEQLQPFEVTLQLSDGKISTDAWTETCTRHGIANAELVPAALRSN